MSLDSMEDRALAHLAGRSASARAAWTTTRPFHWFVMDDFFPQEDAQQLLEGFPSPEGGGWDRTGYVHQQRKLTMTKNLPTKLQSFFDFTANPQFLAWLENITGIAPLLADPELVGGGLHQSLPGAFLDVHIDYNRHMNTGHHRRLNLLLFLNTNWQPEYEGYLELWDMSERRRLTEIAPIFNRAVVFETNQVSYHGHPHPLACPDGVTRKSLAVYYFTEHRDDGVDVPESNTIYRQTTGWKGYMKTFRSSVTSAQARLQRDGIGETGRLMGEKVVRKILRMPPKNQ